MRLRTLAVIGILVLAGAVSQAGQPQAISLLERSEKADNTRFGKIWLPGGKYHEFGWGRRDRQVFGNWNGVLNPYLRP
jgi:hypothetical protein